MEANSNDKVAALIAKGKWNFVFKFGVLLWGISTAVVTTLVKWFFFDAQNPVQLFLVSAVVFSAVGILCGLHLWKRFNRAYEAANQKT